MESVNFVKEDRLTDLKRIGGGNFGTVYLADLKLEDGQQKKVAVKVFENQVKNDDKTLNDYKKEVEKMTKLKHENVVELFGETEIKGKNAFVMELGDDSLDNFIHKERYSYSFGVAINWMMDVAKGIIFIHTNKIIHRDLKPANILVFKMPGGSTRAKIADFGISREDMKNSILTNNVGTLSYMAPEVMQSDDQSRGYDHRCDVYSFGVILWEVFSGEKPFKNMSMFQIKQEVVDGLRPEASGVVICPEEIRKLMNMCWQSDYEKRPNMDQVFKILKIKLMEMYYGWLSNINSSTDEEINKIKFYWRWLENFPKASDSQQKLVDSLKTKKLVNNPKIETVLRAVDLTQSPQIQFNFAKKAFANDPLQASVDITGFKLVVQVLEWTNSNVSIGGRCLFHDRMGYQPLAPCLALMVGPEGRIFIDSDEHNYSSTINTDAFGDIFVWSHAKQHIDEWKNSFDLIVDIDEDIDKIDANAKTWASMLKIGGKLISYDVTDTVWLGEKHQDGSIRATVVGRLFKLTAQRINGLIVERTDDRLKSKFYDGIDEIIDKIGKAVSLANDDQDIDASGQITYRRWLAQIPLKSDKQNRVIESLKANGFYTDWRLEEALKRIDLIKLKKHFNAIVEKLNAIVDGVPIAGKCLFDFTHHNFARSTYLLALLVGPAGRIVTYYRVSDSDIVDSIGIDGSFFAGIFETVDINSIDFDDQHTWTEQLDQFDVCCNFDCIVTQRDDIELDCWEPLLKVGGWLVKWEEYQTDLFVAKKSDRDSMRKSLYRLSST